MVERPHLTAAEERCLLHLAAIPEGKHGYTSRSYGHHSVPTRTADALARLGLARVRPMYGSDGYTVELTPKGRTLAEEIGGSDG